MQMVQAYDAIADGGILRTPQIVDSVGGKRSAPTRGQADHLGARRLPSCATCCAGCSPTAGPRPARRSPATTWPARPGTAKIAVNGKYSNTEFIASFIGMVPASNPKLVVAVVVNQPQGAIYGGSVAAPAFQKIVGWAVPHFGINPCPAPAQPRRRISVTASTP